MFSFWEPVSDLAQAGRQYVMAAIEAGRRTGMCNRLSLEKNVVGLNWQLLPAGRSEQTLTLTFGGFPISVQDITAPNEA